MPILVTGAAGFVGRHLLQELLAAGERVVAWYRPGTEITTRAPALEWRQIEMLDREAVANAVQQLQPSAVYHLAGWAQVAQSWQQTFETYRNNVLGTHHLLRAVQRSVPAARVLVTCSGTIYAPQNRPLREDDPLAPASPYATSKLAQEMLARQAWADDRVPTLIARSFNHTGAGQDPSYVAPGIARQIARIEAGLQEPVLRLGNLDPKRDLSDVRDVVRAYVAIMRVGRAGQPYNVCSGRHLSIRELVETFVARAKVPLTVTQDPALFRPNDTPMMVGDHSRLTNDTGWMPAIPLYETVDELLSYWRTQIEHDHR